MIRILDRYLLRTFLGTYVLSLFVLISLYVVLDLFVNLDEFTEGGRPITVTIRQIASYYFYNLAVYFSQLSGVITLFAACGTLARLQRQHEVTAVLASGTSSYRLAAPIIVAGLAMNTLVLVDQEFVLPRIAPKVVRERDDVEGMRVYQVWCARDGDNHLLSAQQFSPGHEMIGGLIVMELQDDQQAGKQMGAVILADRAEWDGDNHGWKLLGRSVRIMRSGQQGSDTSGQDELVSQSVGFYTSSLTPADLLLRKKAQWLQFLSLDQLRQLVRRGDADPIQAAHVRHGRFTLPISNMVLLLLGIPFFMNRLPASVLTQGAKALAICGIAFLTTFVGQQLVGSAGAFSIALPHWLPIFIFGPVAILLLDGVKT